MIYCVNLQNTLRGKVGDSKDVNTCVVMFFFGREVLQILQAILMLAAASEIRIFD